jgi:hypothetical protein
MKRYIPTILFWTALLAAAWILLGPALNLFISHIVYGVLCRDLGAAALMNPFLVKAMAAGTVVLTCFWVHRVSGAASWRPWKRRPVVTWWFGILAVYNGLLATLTWNHNFDRDGHALRWYNIVDGVIRYAWSGGIDPETGRERKPVTPELWPTLEAFRTGRMRRVTPDNATVWFSQVTGDPELFYVRRGTEIELWNYPGYHPVTQEKLLPVTKAVYEEFVRANKDKVAREAEREAARVLQEQLAKERAELQRLEAERIRAEQRHIRDEELTNTLAATIHRQVEQPGSNNPVVPASRDFDVDDLQWIAPSRQEVKPFVAPIPAPPRPVVVVPPRAPAPFRSPVFFRDRLYRQPVNVRRAPRYCPPPIHRLCGCCHFPDQICPLLGHPTHRRVAR